MVLFWFFSSTKRFISWLRKTHWTKTADLSLSQKEKKLLFSFRDFWTKTIYNTSQIKLTWTMHGLRWSPKVPSDTMRLWGSWGHPWAMESLREPCMPHVSFVFLVLYMIWKIPPLLKFFSRHSLYRKIEVFAMRIKIWGKFGFFLFYSFFISLK